MINFFKKYVCMIVVITIISAVQQPLCAQGESKINRDVLIISKGPRSLRDTLWTLQQQLGFIVTYEDPSYMSPTTIETVFPGGIAIPRSHTIVFQYNQATKESPIAIIQALLSKYHSIDQTVNFDVMPSTVSSSLFNVIPKSEIRQDGEFDAVNSLLNTHVSLSQTDTYYGIVNEIARQLSDAYSGYTVAPSLPPTQRFFVQKVALKGSSVSARKFLNALVSNYNSTKKDYISWDFLRDPRLHFASLNVRKVRSTEKEHDVFLNFESKRPLVNTLKVIEKRQGSLIIYEDIPYLCSCQVWKDKAGKAQALTGSTFHFSYSSADVHANVIESCINAYNQNHLGKFEMKSVSNSSYVYPTVFMNANEKILPHKPLLKTPISFPAKGKTFKENLKALCVALSARTQYKVALGELPLSTLFQQIASDDVMELPAVEYLTKLSQRSEEKMSWQLLYIPKTSGYVLSARLID